MENPDLARRIFAVARTLPELEREAYLSEACDDPGTRDRVDALLADETRATPPGVQALADQTTVQTGATVNVPRYTEREGDTIDHYTLRQKIGEGGFGVVWMAEQSGALNRMVAIKVVKAGMDTGEVLARFEAERQALAMMDHPNIAKVLDAGATAAGRPYFVMELVKGIPVNRFCEEQKLDTVARLALFQDICSAIHHAHQKGIIHRDIKPSNVLVTLVADKPVAKVIDFGIAKATLSKLTEKTLVTRFEQFLGTPIYMSPEQATLSGLDIDTRADIYSLGVLLYELLVGVPPIDPGTFQSAGYDEMRRIIKEEDPPRPSTRLTQTRATGKKLSTSIDISPSALKGDLDWIVMKAIEKDRTRRYQSAHDFAADISRFLADEPVHAAAPSALYKFRKFSRRHKATIGFAALLVAILISATAISVNQALLASQRLEESELARSAEAKAHEATEAVSDYLITVLQSPNPKRDGRAITIAEVLDTAAKELQARDDIDAGRRAQLNRTLGRTYAGLGLHHEAVPLLEQACQHTEQSLGPDDPETILAKASLAESYRAVGRNADALEILEPALEKITGIQGPGHPDTLYLMRNVAQSYQVDGRTDKALEVAGAALSICEKNFGNDHLETIIAMSCVAAYHRESGHTGEAIPLQQKVVERYRAQHGDLHPDTLQAISNLAVFYFDVGNFDDAIDLQEELVSTYRSVEGDEHPETIIAIDTLISLYDAVGEISKQIPLQRDRLEIHRKLDGPDSAEAARAAASLGFLYDDTEASDRTRAITSWQEAVRIDPDQPNVQYWLGKALLEGERYGEAIAPLQAARRHYQQGDRAIASRRWLATTLSSLGREAEAGEILAELAAISSSTRELPPAPKHVIVAPDAEWRWLHPTDGTDPAIQTPGFHPAFATLDFDDSGWRTGTDSDRQPGGFGYGDPGLSAVHIGNPKQEGHGKTAYFRHRFTTDRPFSELELRCQRDDGIVVYLDGREVARDNMPPGPDAYTLPSAESVTNNQETVVQRIPINVDLPAGEHVLAISLHNGTPPSSDLRIAGISLVEPQPE